MTIRSLVRALPFVGALLAGTIAPRFAFAQAAVPQQRVAIASRTLARGTVIADGDFELRDTTMRGATQPDTTPVAAGWVTRRTINAGEILRTPAVEAPTLVNANSPVQVEWTDGNVSLSVRGIAARNGALGERIPVRTEMGKRFDATVVAAGRVRID